jgi:hypothetical protein
MSQKLSSIYKQLNDGTQNGAIIWFEASSRLGFVTATSKGSIKLEKNEFAGDYSLKFLDNNGFVLEEIKVGRHSELHPLFIELYERIRRRLYNVDEKVENILSELGKIPSSLSIENVFPGTWRNDYVFPTHKGSEVFEIRDGKYVIQGKHWFNIEDFSITPDKSEIIFTKVGLPNDPRRLKNILQVITLQKKYEGIEIDEHQGVRITLIYSRIT